MCMMNLKMQDVIFNLTSCLWRDTMEHKYSNEELKTLLTVALLNKYGFKISRIDQMHPAQRDNALLQLPHPDATTERLVNEMISHMIDMNAFLFEELLNKCIQDSGIEN